MIKVKDQVKFFDWQLSELALVWEGYMNSPMQVLFDTSRAFIGELYGIDQIRGNVIFRFFKGNAPRIDNPYSLYLYKLENGAEHLGSWAIKFKDFRASAFCHYRENSDIVPIYYLEKDDDKYRYIGCTNIDIEAFDKFVQDMASGKKTSVILGEKEPPYQFLLNLKAWVSTTKNKDLDLTDYATESYHQVKLSGEDKANLIEKELNLTDMVIIQGPPGTGKSTLTADLVARELKRGKSVCITALSNKALMEIAGKDGIRNLTPEYRVYKTALTRNEVKELPTLRETSEIAGIEKALLLTTYYKLSQPAVIGHKLFDLLIIEEASQAFYPVLSAFAMLAKKTIIIGDPMQLTPIVLNEGFIKTLHPKMPRFVNGLDTLMRTGGNKSYFLNESFRLSAYNAGLTGVFYEDQLIGRNDATPDLVLSPPFRKYFDKSSPYQLMLVEDLSDKNDLTKVGNFIESVVKDIVTHNPGLTIALLTPFKKDVLYFQQEILSDFEGNGSKLIVETVDKVQGLTVDITILVLNMDGNLGFVFNKNRFNVATSRARYYNLLITDRKVKLLRDGISLEVNNFINKLSVVQ